jgi:trans-aconitate methyltransferase
MDQFTFYGHLTRRNPGSVVFTSTYLTPLPLDRHSTIADVGCGFGHRATWVARSRCCQVHAFDKKAEYLEKTHLRAHEGGSDKLISLHQTTDYHALNLAPKSVDVLMAEGAAFDLDSIGAIPQWMTYVKSGGHLVIVVPGVINRHPPHELVDVLSARMNRELKTLEEYQAEVSQHDLSLVHQVQLPSYSWDEHYQNLTRLTRGLIKSEQVTENDEVVQHAQAELDWYRKYGRGRLFLQAFVLAAP